MKKIARVSSTPGKTRLVNFFLINNNFYFVDLPGYGYAHVSFDNQDDFKTRVEKYLDFRPQLKAAVLLLDIRRVPNPDDLMMYAYFKAKIIPIVFILTKADKITNNDRLKQIASIRQVFPAEKTEQFILFSATTKENVTQIWDILEKRITKTA
jgi:GTP-binding protein